MKNFKVGDVVYDEVNFPNQKGIVDKIDKYDDKNPIGVNYHHQYQWYSIDGECHGVKVLSHTPYTIEFKGFSQERPKVLTDAMKVCIKGDGTTEYGKKIIEYLEGLGGRNEYLLKGTDLGTNTHGVYFIDKDFIINIASIPKGYKKISLKEVEPICYVGKKIVIDNAIYQIICQTNSQIYYSINPMTWTRVLISEINNYKIID